MSLVVSKLAKSSSGVRYTPKAGTVPARILSVVDLGVQPRAPFQGQEKDPVRQVLITFELPNDKFEYNGEMVPARISPKAMTLSNDPKSALFKFMNTFDPTNSLGGDLSQYVGKPCLLTIVHNKVQKDGKEVTYANIAGCMPAPDGFPVPELYDEPFVFEFDNPTLDALSKMPEYQREKVRGAVNYKGSAVEPLMAEHEAEWNKKKAERQQAEVATVPAKATGKGGKAPY